MEGKPPARRLPLARALAMQQAPGDVSGRVRVPSSFVVRQPTGLGVRGWRSNGSTT
jgi:hypothetical protein